MCKERKGLFEVKFINKDREVILVDTPNPDSCAFASLKDIQEVKINLKLQKEGEGSDLVQELVCFQKGLPEQCLKKQVVEVKRQRVCSTLNDPTRFEGEEGLQVSVEDLIRFQVGQVKKERLEEECCAHCQTSNFTFLSSALERMPHYLLLTLDWNLKLEDNQQDFLIEGVRVGARLDQKIVFDPTRKSSQPFLLSVQAFTLQRQYLNQELKPDQSQQFQTYVRAPSLKVPQPLEGKSQKGDEKKKRKKKENEKKQRKEAVLHQLQEPAQKVLITHQWFVYNQESITKSYLEDLNSTGDMRLKQTKEGESSSIVAFALSS